MKGLSVAGRGALLAELEGMPEFLAGMFGDLSSEAARRGGPQATFSPVEQCWHLADLEVEGFGVRIRRLLDETRPFLPHFDGAAVARERDYGARSLVEGLQAFRVARESNVALLRSVTEEAHRLTNPRFYEREPVLPYGLNSGVGRIVAG